MHRLVFPLAALALLVMQNAFMPAAAAESLTAALTAARADADVPFSLRIDCADGASRRSLAVIRGDVAVWGNERQVRLAAKDRSALIELLIEADFEHFAPRYGERPKADKQEAPLKVSCRIHVALRGVEKSSVQLLDGEPSERLLGLARQLLDRIEPLAAGGVTAATLEDGLAKLADGALAAEIVELRLVTIPDAGNAKPGAILRIEGGQVSRQDYAPGTAIGAVRTEDLTECQLRDVISALYDARFWELPVNLRADTLTELEVRVLSQRKTVIARPSFKAAPPPQQAALAELLGQLADLPAACNG